MPRMSHLFENTQTRSTHAQFQERFELCFKNAPIGMMYLNKEGIVTDMNSKTESLLQLVNSRDLLHINVLHYSPWIEAGLSETVRDVIQNSQAHIIECDYVNAEGRHLPLRFYLEAIIDPESQLIQGVYVIIEEMMYKKKVHDAVQVQKNLYQNIIDNIPHGIYWKDKNYKYLGCNQAFAEKAGFKNPSELIGKDDLVMPWKTEETKIFRSIDEKVIQSGVKILDIEQTESWNDGQPRTILTSKVPLLDSNNELIGVLGIDADISKLREAEEKLIDLYKHLGSLNRKISILLAMKKKPKIHDQEEITAVLMQSAMNLSQAKSVALFQSKNQALRLMTSTGLTPSQSQLEYQKKAELSYLTPLTEKKIRLQKIFNEKELTHSFMDKHLHYLLGIPLLHEETLIGALFFGFDQQKHLSTQELDFYDAFALEASQALKAVLV